VVVLQDERSRSSVSLRGTESEPGGATDASLSDHTGTASPGETLWFIYLAVVLRLSTCPFVTRIGEHGIKSQRPSVRES